MHRKTSTDWSVLLYIPYTIYIIGLQGLTSLNDVFTDFFSYQLHHNWCGTQVMLRIQDLWPADSVRWVQRDKKAHPRITHRWAARVRTKCCSNEMLLLLVFEVAGSAFAAVALVAGGDAFQLAFGKYWFHLDLPATGAEELLCNHVHPSIFADFSHSFSSSLLTGLTNYRNLQSQSSITIFNHNRR